MVSPNDTYVAEYQWYDVSLLFGILSSFSRLKQTHAVFSSCFVFLSFWFNSLGVSLGHWDINGSNRPETCIRYFGFMSFYFLAFFPICEKFIEQMMAKARATIAMEDKQPFRSCVWHYGARKMVKRFAWFTCAIFFYLAGVGCAVLRWFHGHNYLAPQMKNVEEK